MKILKKLGMITTSIFISMKALALRVYGSYIGYEVQESYGVPSRIPVIRRFISSIVVLVILLVGVIVYCVKSKSSKLKKVIVCIGAVLVYILFRILIKNVF